MSVAQQLEPQAPPPRRVHAQRVFWTQERRIERLQELVENLHSSTEIAEIIGCSRNAIIGKVKRLGLRLRGREKYAQQRADKPKKPPKPKFVRPPTLRASPHQFEAACKVVDQDKVVKLKALEADHCRWPIGEPDEFMAYCGYPPLPGLPYCAGHCRMAYQPRGGR